MQYLIPIVFLLLFSCRGSKVIDFKGFQYLEQETPGNIPQIFGKDIVSVKGRFELGFTMSPDSRSIVFGVAKEADPGETCIYLMNYKNSKWNSPQKAPFTSNRNTFFPMFSPEGDKLYFAKSTDNEEPDLWVVEYLNNNLIEPRPLGSLINSGAREAGHGKSKNGSFYFTSNRDSENQCCGDIFYSVLGSEGITNIQKVKSLNSEADEESLFLSPSEEYIIFQAWKNEFESKHDLYISYQTKAGEWTRPQRLHSDINSKEIEQRPFVSADNNFLFFNRMSITKEHGEGVYESDVYWVSTALIFEPFIYNPKVEFKVKNDEPFEVLFPKDLFQDIDGKKLSYEVSLEDNSEWPKWMKFDVNDFALRGVWKSKVSVSINVTATDISGNSGEFKFKLEEKSQ